MPNDKQSRAELVEALNLDEAALVFWADYPEEVRAGVDAALRASAAARAFDNASPRRAMLAAVRAYMEIAKQPPEAATVIENQASRIEALEAENARLREALTPFAEASSGIDDSCHPDWEMWEHPAAMNVFVRDFRRARSALNPERSEK